MFLESFCAMFAESFIQNYAYYTPILCFCALGLLIIYSQAYVRLKNRSIDIKLNLLDNSTSTRRLLIENEFPGLKNGLIYLDYAGGALPSRTHLLKCTESYLTLYGNPHTKGHFSTKSTCEMNLSKDIVLSFLGTTSEKYSIIWTSGATDALQTLAHSFPWSQHSTFKFVKDCHTSVLGIRELATKWDCVSNDEMKQYLKSNNTAHNNNSIDTKLNNIGKSTTINETCTKQLRQREKEEKNNTYYDLFALPAECNFSGARYDLNIIDNIQRDKTTLVLLDAAKYCGSSKLDLGELSPAFCVLSFYKLFGYPTGLGALIVRNDVKNLLQKKYFGGGTISMVSVCKSKSKLSNKRLFPLQQQEQQLDNNKMNTTNKQNKIDHKEHHEQHRMKNDFQSRMSDGTDHYLGVISLRYGFEQLEKYGGMDAIHSHTMKLAQYFYNNLSSMEHLNGRNVATIYGYWSYLSTITATTSTTRPCTSDDKRYINNHHRDDTTPSEAAAAQEGVASTSSSTSTSSVSTSSSLVGHSSQGPVVCFNLFHSDGNCIGFSELQNLCELHHIQVRTGCMCNPGACQHYLHLSSDEIFHNLNKFGKECGDDQDVINNKHTGAIRVSLGYSNSYEDIDKLLNVIRSHFIDHYSNNDNNSNSIISTTTNTTVCYSNSTTKEYPDVEVTRELASSKKALLKIAAMYIYPIKSCKHVSLASHWPIDRSTGSLQFDRSFVILTPSGLVLTQKICSKMRHITPHIHSNSNVLNNSDVVNNSDGINNTREMYITAPNMPTLVVDLNNVPTFLNYHDNDNDIKEKGDSNQKTHFKVCVGGAFKEGFMLLETKNWFTQYLGRPCVLVYQGTTTTCSTNNISCSDISHSLSPHRGSYANQAPISIIVKESLDFLSSELTLQSQKETDLKRNTMLIHPLQFRPNIVLHGGSPLQEMHWKYLQIQRERLRFIKVGDISRCKMINIPQGQSGQNQERCTSSGTSNSSDNLLKKMSQYYFRRNVDSDNNNSKKTKQFGKNLVFGVNVYPVSTTINDGDDIFLKIGMNITAHFN